MISLLSWVACGVLLLGLYLIGDKRRLGLWVALFAEFIWIAWAVLSHAWAVVFMSTVICGMYVRAIRSWGQS